MPSATSDKLNQLRSQLQECSDPTVTKLLRSAISKLEAQLNSGQVQTKVSKIDQRKSALRKSQKQAKRKTAQQERTTLKPPSITKVEPQSEAISQKDLPTSPAQDRLQEQTEVTAQNESSTSLPQTTPEHAEPAPPTPKLLDKTEFPEKTPRSTRPAKRKSDSRNVLVAPEPGIGQGDEDGRTPKVPRKKAKPDRISRPAPSEAPQTSQPKTPRVSAELERRFRELELSQKNLVEQVRKGGELEHLAVAKNGFGQYLIVVKGTGKPFVRQPFTTPESCFECAVEIEEMFEIEQVVELRLTETMERIEEMAQAGLERERVARVLG